MSIQNPPARRLSFTVSITDGGAHLAFLVVLSVALFPLSSLANPTLTVECLDASLVPGQSSSYRISLDATGFPDQVVGISIMQISLPSVIAIPLDGHDIFSSGSDTSGTYLGGVWQGETVSGGNSIHDDWAFFGMAASSLPGPIEPNDETIIYAFTVDENAAPGVYTISINAAELTAFDGVNPPYGLDFAPQDLISGSFTVLPLGDMMIRTVPAQQTWIADGVTEYRMDVYADSRQVPIFEIVSAAWDVNIASAGLTCTRAELPDTLFNPSTNSADFFFEQPPHFDGLMDSAMNRVDSDFSGGESTNNVRITANGAYHGPMDREGILGSYWFVVEQGTTPGLYTFDVNEVRFLDPDLFQWRSEDTGGVPGTNFVGEIHDTFTIIAPPPICGDGSIEGEEECDDSNTADDDGCSSTCTEEAGWTCTGEPSVCTEICGDGLVVGAEACDDGYSDDCGTCDATCTGAGSGSTCGDGVVCPESESCDDGYTDACGTCNAGCTGPGTGSACGDGAICPETEDCDDGYADACGGCNTDCTAPGSGSTCGDGSWCPETEACDDGGESATCDADCTAVACGDGMPNLTAGEECDDGLNNGAGDGFCLSDCSGVQTCGDGSIEGSEECDDGNTDDGDGCSSTCTVDPGSKCIGEPSVCITGIPAVSEWGLVVMSLLVLTAATLVLIHRRRWSRVA